MEILDETEHMLVQMVSKCADVDPAEEVDILRR